MKNKNIEIDKQSLLEKENVNYYIPLDVCNNKERSCVWVKTTKSQLAKSFLWSPKSNIANVCIKKGRNGKTDIQINFIK